LPTILLGVMPNLFDLFRAHPEPDDPKEAFLIKLLKDVDSQLTPERLQSDKKLFDALTDAAVGGGLDDKQYAVGQVGIAVHVSR
jgi:hypothetical protein